MSFDDYVITGLMAGVNSETLPVIIYGMAHKGISPDIDALSMSITCGPGVCILLAGRLEQRTQGVMNRRICWLGVTGATAGCWLQGPALVENSIPYPPPEVQSCGEYFPASAASFPAIVRPLLDRDQVVLTCKAVQLAAQPVAASY